jgi:adenine-specific DNA-methyltransferase
MGKKKSGAKPKKLAGKSPPVGAIKHKDTRPNIPTREQGAMVAAEEAAPKEMLYPRDQSLDPQLVWKGKDSQDAKPLDVPSVPIYIQEKGHPQAIIEDLRERALAGKAQQLDLFSDFNGLNGDPAKRTEFYKHDQHWTNRLILGDSLLVMTSLAEKERLKGRVQMIYIDPPYGIKFGSNWQISTRKRDVKDAKPEEVTRQPEQIKAFRDTWRLGIHSYLNYLRDRLVAARELLTESGSIFVQIGDENVHLVRSLMDEVLGSENSCGLITYTKTTTTTGDLLPGTTDFILWYAKSKDRVKYKQLYLEKAVAGAGGSGYSHIEEADGKRRPLSPEERDNPSRVPQGSRVYSLDNLTSPRVREARTGYFQIRIDGRSILPQKGEWKTHREGIARLIAANRVQLIGNTPRYIRFIDDFPAYPLNNVWPDTGIAGFASQKRYIVETSTKVVQRCLLMTTDPGDLVLDPTCGSATTA